MKRGGLAKGTSEGMKERRRAGKGRSGRMIKWGAIKKKKEEEEEKGKKKVRGKGFKGELSVEINEK